MTAQVISLNHDCGTQGSSAVTVSRNNGDIEDAIQHVNAWVL